MFDTSVERSDLSTSEVNRNPEQPVEKFDKNCFEKTHQVGNVVNIRKR